MPFIRRLSERGSALIETLVAAPIIAIVLMTGSLLMYRWLAEVWMTRAAREAAVCLTSQVRASRCKQKLETTLKIGLPFGRAEIDECRLRSRDANVRLSLDLRSIFLRSVFDQNVRSSFESQSFPTRIETEVSFPRFD